MSPLASSHSRVQAVSPQAVTLLVLCVLFSAAASASVSTDADFIDISDKLVSWSQGTLGTVLRMGSLLIGMALAIKTQRLPIPISVTLVSIYFPDVVDTVFGAIV